MKAALRLIAIVAWTIAAVEALLLGVYAVKELSSGRKELRKKMDIAQVTLDEAMAAADLFARDLPPGIRAMRASYGLAWASLLGTLALVGLILEERLLPAEHPSRSRRRRPSLVPPAIFPTPAPVFPPPPP